MGIKLSFLIHNFWLYPSINISVAIFMYLGCLAHLWQSFVVEYEKNPCIFERISEFCINNFKWFIYVLSKFKYVLPAHCSVSFLRIFYIPIFFQVRIKNHDHFCILGRSSHSKTSRCSLNNVERTNSIRQSRILAEYIGFISNVIILIIVSSIVKIT